jgi:hypothetical protein
MTLNSSASTVAQTSRTLRAVAASIKRSAQDPLAIYLNDHLAGATGGLELMRLVVEAKAAGWRTLRTLAGGDSRLDAVQLDELISRARRQADFLEGSRIKAAQQVIDAAGAGHG